MKYYLLFIIFLLRFTSLNGQTFTGTGGLIPDDGSTIEFNVNVSGIPFTSIDTLFGLENVCLNVVHPYVSDLDIWLVAPNGSVIELTSGNGGNGDNYTNTCFYDSVNTTIIAGSAPFNGSFSPEGHLYHVNNGQNPNAIWKLRIHDNFPNSDQGTLINWSVTFASHPYIPFVFTSSNLPIVKINTYGYTILDDPKIISEMQIIDNGPGNRNYVNDPPNGYNSFVGIELRGTSSQTFPKKSYGLETCDTLANETNISLLGMPAEHDWILTANYTDKTMIRNVLSYNLSEAMGNYAPRCRYVELLINGQYAGVYVLMEKIKRDANRVDISKMTSADTSGVQVTGGYIVKIDKPTGAGNAGWQTLYPPISGGPSPRVLFDYPKATDILPAQANYIHAYVDSFENALAGPQFTDPLMGYAAFADVNSFIDLFIINELSKNVDGYRISTYFYKLKDTKGSKLHMGPVWDYDIAWGNADYFNGWMTSGYSYQFPSSTDPNQPPFWWDRLMQDSVYRNNLKCRWVNLRSNVLSSANIFERIDSIALLLNESQQRNFIEWPILGIYVWPNPSPIPATYTGEVVALKNFILGRANWLDTHLPGNCSIVGMNSISQEPNNLLVIANVNPGITTVKYSGSDRGTVSISLRDLLGRNILTQHFEKEQEDFNENISSPTLRSGIYFLNVSGKNFSAGKKIMIK